MCECELVVNSWREVKRENETKPVLFSLSICLFVNCLIIAWLLSLSLVSVFCLGMFFGDYCVCSTLLK